MDAHAAAAANKLLTHTSTKLHAPPYFSLLRFYYTRRKPAEGGRGGNRSGSAAGRGTAPIEKHHEPLCASSTTLLEAGLNGKLPTFATSHGLAIHFGRVHKEGGRATTSATSTATRKRRAENAPAAPQARAQKRGRPQAAPAQPFWNQFSSLIGRRLIRPEALCLEEPFACGSGWFTACKHIPNGEKVLEEEEEKKEKEKKEEEEEEKEKEKEKKEEEEEEKEKEEEEKNQKGLLGLIEGLVPSRPAVQLTKKGKNGEEKPVVGRVEKIRLYPRSEQKKTLAKWFGTVRWTYNKAVEFHREHQGMPRDEMKEQVRKKFLNNGNFNGENKSLAWVLETPRFIRSDAVDDFFNGVKSSLAAGRGTTGFQMKFRGRKDKSQSLSIQAREWNHNSSIRQLFFGEARIKARDKNYKVPSEVLYAVRLVKDTRLGHYYLCVPQPLKLMGESQAREHRRREAGIIALDPGVRTFMTTYNGCGEVTEWGKADINEIGKLCHRLDRMQSKGTKVNHRQRRRLRRAAARLRQRIRNLVDDLHKKLVSWLVRNFSLILLPEFRSQQMVRRGHRRIGSRTARAMLTWSHYRFRQRLLNKAQQFPSCTVCLCDEEYTSKTCGKCGQVHHQLGETRPFGAPNPSVATRRIEMPTPPETS
ncbi:Transposase [Balamuthia mandrillaris]